MYFKNPLGKAARGFFDQYKAFVDYYKSIEKAESFSNSVEETEALLTDAVV